MHRPRSTEDVREILATAHCTRTPLEIRGNGTKSGVGAKPSAAQTVEIAGLSGILEYEMAELVLTARAGTPVAEIEAVLAANRQMLGFEPADYGPLFGRARDQATIGGLLAGNICGPRRLQHGAARDHFLGFTAVSGRGEVFKAGGRVVKNVTGFDLPKLLAGSWGTLAVLTEVTVKVLPRPATVTTVAIAGLSAQDAARAMNHAVGSPVELSAAAHLPRWVTASFPAGLATSVAESLTVLRIDGFEPSVAARCRWLCDSLRDFGVPTLLGPTQSADLWQYIRNVRPMCESNDALWRIQAPPMDGWRVENAMAPHDVRVLYDLAGGLVWLAASVDVDAATIHKAAQQARGHATLIRAPDNLREELAVSPSAPAALVDLSKRVKAAFDPAGILNPGRRLPA